MAMAIEEVVDPVEDNRCLDALFAAKGGQAGQMGARRAAGDGDSLGVDLEVDPVVFDPIEDLEGTVRWSGKVAWGERG